MAVFQKLFSPRRPPRCDSQHNHQSFWNYGSKQKTTSIKLEKAQIRLIIYGDSERGRTPFFDSKAIRCTEESNKDVASKARSKIRLSTQRENSCPQQKPQPKYHFQRLDPDVHVIEEMMFGNVAMSYKGHTLKVHEIRSPHQLMITKVFYPVKPKGEMSVDTENSDASLQSSTSEFSSGDFSRLTRMSKGRYNSSIPVDVPKERFQDYSTDDDSGLASFTSSGSLRTSIPSPNNSSHSSLHRRWMRAQTTSFDQPRNIIQETQANQSGMKRPRSQKLAVGILFGPFDEKDEESCSLFQSFLFSHFALIEDHVEKLSSTIEKAYFNSKVFLPSIMESLQQFRNEIYDLYTAPRLVEPVWLKMMSATSKKSELFEKFMKEFGALVSIYDNKHYKFFVSTLLSAVLTQHLAWVATVIPAGEKSLKSTLDKNPAKWVDALAKTHPYNPLWAQLGDLFGAVSMPRKIARTIVVGKKASTVKRFLTLLSYFIRCSDVSENLNPQGLGGLLQDSELDQVLTQSHNEKSTESLYSGDSNLSSPTLFTRQTSGDFGGLLNKPVAKTKPLEAEKTSKLSSISQSSNWQHSVQTSESPVVRKTERSDSGYNGVTLEHNISVNSGKSTESDKENACSNSQIRVKFHGDGCLENKNLSYDSFSDVDFDSLSVKVNHGSDNSDLENSTNKSKSSPQKGLSDLHILDFKSHSHCCETSSIVIESQKVERVVSVNRAAAEIAIPNLQISPSCTSKSVDGKVKSRLALLLETKTGPQKPVDPKKQFHKEGSVSMFDEYFKEDVDVKTIDDIQEQDRLPSSSFSLSMSKVASVEGSKESDNESAKAQYTHQLSQESKSVGGRPSSLGRCRPVTPTELNRRRHISSTSSIDFATFDPMLHCMQINLENLMSDSESWNKQPFDLNFGRSLLAGYSDHYLSDFVLHGTSDTNFKSRLLNDLQMSVQHSSVLDEPVEDAVCVIADTDNWTVEVASAHAMAKCPSGCVTWTYSQLVADMVESVQEIYKLKMSPEFCLMHLEDQLQEIYFKSAVLAKHTNGCNNFSQHDLKAILGIETSDLPLLCAVAQSTITVA